MSKYKEGDHVLVRSDLQHGMFYKHGDGSDITYVKQMDKWLGQIAEITLAHPSFYRIGGRGWAWSDDMFVGLADEGNVHEVNVSDLMEVLDV